MADKRIKGITIELDGDTTGLQKALNAPEKSIKNIQDELRQVERLLKLDPANTELLTQKQKLLGDAIKETSTKLSTLKEAEKQAQEQFKSGKINEEQYRALQREIEQTGQKIKSLKKEVKDLETDISDKLQIAGMKFQEFGDKATEAGKKMLPITGAITAVGTVAAKSAIDFESAFAGVKKTVNATDEELEIMRGGLREMAKEIPVSAKSLAGIAESAGQLGIQTPNVLSFTRTIADLGVSTNLSGEQAASSLAKFANITQMSQQDFDKMGSTIVALGNNFATTESDIVNMSMRLAGAGTQIGLSEAEILSFATALSSVGIEAEAGGSAFSKVMINMQLAVETGGESLEDFAKVAGMTADDFAKKFKKDASGAITEFIKGLQNTKNSGTSAIKVLDDMGITEVRMRDALLRAASAGDVFNESIKLGASAWEENTALTKEAETRYGTTASQIDMAKNAAVDLGISFGELLLPYILKLIEGLNGVVEKFSNLSEEDKKTIIAIAAVVAAVGPLLIIIGQLSGGVGTVISVVGKLIPLLFGTATAEGAAATSTGLLSGALNFLAANPIVLVIAAIVAFIAIIMHLWNTNENFRNAVMEIWAKIQEIFQVFDDWLQEVFATDWTTQFGAFGEVLNAFFKNMSNIWDAIKAIFKGIIDFLKAVFTKDWEGAWTAVKDIFKGIFDLLVGIAKVPLNAVIGFVNSAIDGVNTLIRALNTLLGMPSKVLKKLGIDVDFSIPTVPKIPMLANGGILSSGSAIVGEFAPELLTVKGGRAIVQPLTSAQRSGGATGQTIHQTNYFDNYKPRDGAAAARDLNRQLGRQYT